MAIHKRGSISRFFKHMLILTEGVGAAELSGINAGLRDDADARVNHRPWPNPTNGRKRCCFGIPQL
jgi:hypothetical protein